MKGKMISNLKKLKLNTENISLIYLMLFPIITLFNNEMNTNVIISVVIAMLFILKSGRKIKKMILLALSVLVPFITMSIGNINNNDEIIKIRKYAI